MARIQVGEDTLEVPDGLTDAQIDNIAKTHAQAKWNEREQGVARDVYADANPLVKAAVGVGAAAAEPVLGIGQLAAQGAQWLGVPGAGAALRGIRNTTNSVRGARQGAGGWGTAGEAASWAAMPQVGAERIAMKLPQAAQGIGRLVAGLGSSAGEQAAYEGLKGTQAGDQSRLDAAKSGAEYGALGHGVGRVAGKVAGSLAGGVRAIPGAEALMREAESAGGRLRLSAGQALGGGWSKAEEGLGSLPFVGSLVRGRRDNAMNDWAMGQLKKAVKGIDPLRAGAVKGVDDVLNLIDQGYRRAMGGVTVHLPTTVNPFKRTIQAAQDLSDPADQAIVQNVITRHLVQMHSGKLSGDQIIEARSALRQEASDLYRQGRTALGDVLDQAKDDFTDTARHFMSDMQRKLYDATNAAYQRVKPITRAAAYKGAVTSDVPFTPTQLISGEMAGAPKSRIARGGSAQQQEAVAAEKVLGSKLPGQSPTAEKLVTMGLPAAAAFGAQELSDGKFPNAWMGGVAPLAAATGLWALAPKGARARGIGNALRNVGKNQGGRVASRVFLDQDQE